MATVEEVADDVSKVNLHRIPYGTIETGEFVFNRIKSIGGSIMKEENESINQMNEMRSHLYQIKILLLILITMCALGFYAISRSMWGNITGTITGISEILLVAVILTTPVLLFVWIRVMNNPLKNESQN